MSAEVSGSYQAQSLFLLVHLISRIISKIIDLQLLHLARTNAAATPSTDFFNY
jgi:hypothetical protein